MKTENEATEGKINAIWVVVFVVIFWFAVLKLTGVL
jgi:hypothetical protein